MWQREFNKAWSLPPGEREQALAQLRTQTTVMAAAGAGGVSLNAGGLATAYALPTLTAYAMNPQMQSYLEVGLEMLSPNPGSTAPTSTWVRHYFKTAKGTVNFLAEATATGKILNLKNVMIFPKGGGKIKLGTKGVLKMKNEIAQIAKEAGFEKVVIQGERLTGANPG
jgi:hypothetical protein